MTGYRLPTFEHEESLLSRGFVAVAGVDEAGAGCWAGPVYAGAVIFDPATAAAPPWPMGLIRDSKTLSPLQRRRAAAIIKECAMAWAVGKVEAATIDRINIRRASELAMVRAIANLTRQPDYVLVDFRQLTGLAMPNRGIIGGDAISLSIAAASIIAKTERDALMEEIARQYPGYGFEAHKGYGTKAHQEALRQLGPSAQHRLSYRPVKEASAELAGRQTR